MRLVSMLNSYPRQSFGIISLQFSEYTLSLAGRVFGEHRGGAAEILSWIGVEHGSNLIYGSSCGIRTYPHLLDSRNIVQMQLMFILLASIYVRGWRTVSGCTRAMQVRVRSPMNGSTRPMLSWNGHLAWLLKERVKFVVPTVNVQTGKDK